MQTAAKLRVSRIAPLGLVLLLGCHATPPTLSLLTRDAFIGNYSYGSAGASSATKRAHALDRLVLKSDGRYELVRGASQKSRTEQEGMWSFDNGTRPTITLEEEGYRIRAAGDEVRLLIGDEQNEWYVKAAPR